MTLTVVLKNIHPSTDLNDIKQSLTDKGHVVTNIWNVKQRVTKKPLPMHFIDIKPRNNNKEIYKIIILLNTILKFEAPHAKREIPQCRRCQKFGHTKNYCRDNPRSVKCAAQHVTNECPKKVREDNVKCVNCNLKNPAYYRGRMVNKQIQQKIYPRLRERNIATRPIQSGVTYAQAVQEQTEIPQTNVKN
jgi:PAX-interacting protein 1